jgi:hypothetical protein
MTKHLNFSNTGYVLVAGAGVNKNADNHGALTKFA